MDFEAFDALEDIGLTNSEVKVYLSLIELGESSVGAITSKAKIASSKTYEVLDKLMDKGLVTTYLNNKTKFFKAVHPRMIRSYIEDKKKSFEEQEKKASIVLPRLERIFSEQSKETEVELYKGYSGVGAVFSEMIDTLKRGEEFLVMGGGDSPTSNERTKMFFERIHKKRSNKGIKLRIIFSEKRKKHMKGITLFPFTNARYIAYGTPSTINIFKDTVLLLVMSPAPAGIRIRDSRIAESYKKYFDELWKGAKT
jgi:HTH-type transcriptional regulator, sugar sensing transcriptional regulator